MLIQKLTVSLTVRKTINNWRINFSLLRLVLTAYLLFLGSAQALVNGTKVKPDQWRSVVLLELLNPENGLTTTCTGVVISSVAIMTTASCVLYEETGKQTTKVKVCIGHKKPFNTANQKCISSRQIFSHPSYIGYAGSVLANDLAYIILKSPLDLKALNITAAKVITPDEFSQRVVNQDFKSITWVGFDGTNLKGNSPRVKQEGIVNSAEFDYNSLAVKVSSSKIRPGNHYQGVASFIKDNKGDWRLLGLISQSSPDNPIDYYPEINPCDEDPIIVKHPKPIMRAETSISVYPIAACGMVGFIKLDGYNELSCKKLLSRNLDFESALDNEQPAALRQKAIQLYNSNESKNDSAEIYQLLYKAQSKGDSSSAIFLAELLLNDIVFSRDPGQALELLEGLTDKSTPRAQLLISKMLLFTNLDSTIKASTSEQDSYIFALLDSSARAGLSEAQYLVARLYQKGIGIEKSHTKAHYWYTISAMQGHANAQFQLGMQWSDGRGVRAYPEIALFWTEQAAAQGHLNAQNYLNSLRNLVDELY